MAAERKKELAIDIERILRHPARPRILLGLHADGPMSPTELSRSRIGRGIRARVYDFHLKELVRIGLVEVVDGAPRHGRGVRYAVTDQLTQTLIDAAALEAVSGVIASIPTALAQWFEQPYIAEITEFVRASGRR
jgi:hypothetical protein